MSHPRHVWSDRWTQLGAPRPADADPWLDRWTALVAPLAPGPALDMGCGRGGDVRSLLGQGFRVVAGDFASGGLCLVGDVAPEALRYRADFSLGLPFTDASFALVVSNLCVHYYNRDTTRRIVGEVRRCLRPEGLLLLRVNSTADIHHGAGSREQVEPDLFRVGPVAKRFYDEPRVRDLLDTGWHVLSLEEYSKPCESGNAKVLWEAVARKGVL